MIAALALGFAFGWVGSMPVAGAVSAFVCERGLAGRSGHGRTLAAGAALTESLWCFLVLTGAGKLLTRWPQLDRAAMTIGGALLVVLGAFFLLRRARRETHAAAALPRHRDEFRLGVTLVAANLAVPVNWLVLTTVAVSMGLDPTRTPASFAAGVGLGILSWYTVLLRVIAAYRARVGDTIQGRLRRGLGVLLVAAGVVALLRAWL